MKKIVATIALLLALAIAYHAGRCAGARDVIETSEIWTENRTIYIDFAGNLYTHTID